MPRSTWEFRSASPPCEAPLRSHLRDGQDGRSGPRRPAVNRQLTFGDLRFNQEGKLKRARLATFDLARVGADKRMNLTGGDPTLWIVVGAVAAGVAACLLADCFDSDDEGDID